MQRSQYLVRHFSAFTVFSPSQAFPAFNQIRLGGKLLRADPRFIEANFQGASRVEHRWRVILVFPNSEGRGFTDGRHCQRLAPHARFPARALTYLTIEWPTIWRRYCGQATIPRSKSLCHRGSRSWGLSLISDVANDRLV